MQAGESIRRSLLYHLFGMGNWWELVGNREADLPEYPPPPSSWMSVVSGSSTTHSSDRQNFTPWAVSVVEPQLPPPSLPAFRALVSALRTFPLWSHRPLYRSLCCLRCPVHLLPLRDPVSCIGAFSQASSQRAFLGGLRQSSCLCSDAVRSACVGV